MAIRERLHSGSRHKLGGRFTQRVATVEIDFRAPHVLAWTSPATPCTTPLPVITGVCTYCRIRFVNVHHSGDEFRALHGARCKDDGDHCRRVVRGSCKLLFFYETPTCPLAVFPVQIGRRPQSIKTLTRSLSFSMPFLFGGQNKKTRIMRTFAVNRIHAFSYSIFIVVVRPFTFALHTLHKSYNCDEL